ncbi:MAG: hypothetical protein MI754_10535 [Chromatiales bacterium]|nr:hypothetical protein [Chromatiales bacterium]
MSKCNPESATVALAIANFLRSVHVNGKPLDLPDSIEDIHTNPRNQLDMINAIDTTQLKGDVRVFDITNAATEQLNDRMEKLDARLDLILSKLDK